MKKTGILFILLCLLSSSAVMANKEKKLTSKIGETIDDIPCTCIFNKNRMWNPEKIVWNNEEWECKKYKDDGTCAEVQKIKSDIVE